jgi:hypothetical protein
MTVRGGRRHALSAILPTRSTGQDQLAGDRVRYPAPSSVVITLEEFSLGFPLYPGEPQMQKPGFFFIGIHRSSAGGTQWCVHPDNGVCFQRPP